jgi:hypothetical protein
MSFSLRVSLMVAVVLLAALAWPQPVAAQVRRCTTADGSTIFTDRRCADIGAVERLPRAAAGSAGGLRLYRRGCARNLQDLVYEMTTAIDAHDANRLAGVYHWVGITGTGANGIMARLDTIVRRPLVDITPVAARSPASEDGEAYYPSTIPQRSAPVALRVEQTLGNASTPSRTVFGLQRHFDCWWIRL